MISVANFEIMKKMWIILVVLVLSCTSITKRENDPKDIDRASLLMDRFYLEVKNKDFEKASKFSGGGLSPSELKSVLIKIDSIWGGIKKYKLVWGKTSVTETNGNVSGEYQLMYEVEYDKSENNEENVSLSLERDSLVITGFHSKQILVNGK